MRELYAISDMEVRLQLIRKLQQHTWEETKNQSCPYTKANCQTRTDGR